MFYFVPEQCSVSTPCVCCTRKEHKFNLCTEFLRPNWSDWSNRSKPVCVKQGPNFASFPSNVHCPAMCTYRNAFFRDLSALPKHRVTHFPSFFPSKVSINYQPHHQPATEALIQQTYYNKRNYRQQH